MHEITLVDCSIHIRRLRQATQGDSRFLRRIHRHDGLLLQQEVVVPASGDARRSLFYRYRANRMRCVFYMPGVFSVAEVRARLRSSQFVHLDDIVCEYLTLSAGAWLQFYCTFRPMIARPRFGPNSSAGDRNADVYQANYARDELARPSESYRQWFDEALGTGAIAPSMSILDIQDQRLWIEKHPRVWDLEKGNDVRVKGIINVLDPDIFAATLLDGIGGHTAYGYGFLLLKQISAQDGSGEVVPEL